MKAIVSVLFVTCVTVSVVLSSGSPNDIQKSRVSPAGRIVGGNDAERLQFPYQASLQFPIKDRFYHTCGGTLINETRILTAAHCEPKSLKHFRAVFGMLSLDDIDNPDVQIRSVKEFKSHPGYSGGHNSGPNDIAIIVLSEPVKLTPAVKIAKMGNKEDCNAIDTALLSGWGATNWKQPTYPRKLQYAELPRITFEECAKNLTNIVGHSKPLDETQLCTSPSPGLSQSGCFTDSGGPLVHSSNKKLIGVAAWAIFPCGLEDAPTMYTSVCSHLNFINNN